MAQIHHGQLQRLQQSLASVHAALEVKSEALSRAEAGRVRLRARLGRAAHRGGGGDRALDRQLRQTQRQLQRLSAGGDDERQAALDAARRRRWTRPSPPASARRRRPSWRRSRRRSRSSGSRRRSRPSTTSSCRRSSRRRGGGSASPRAREEAMQRRLEDRSRARRPPTRTPGSAQPGGVGGNGVARRARQRGLVAAAPGGSMVEALADDACSGARLDVHHRAAATGAAGELPHRHGRARAIAGGERALKAELAGER